MSLKAKGNCESDPPGFSRSREIMELGEMTLTVHFCSLEMTDQSLSRSVSQLSVNSVGGEGTINPQGDEEPAILIVVVTVWLECGPLDEHLKQEEPRSSPDNKAAAGVGVDSTFLSLNPQF